MDVTGRVMTLSEFNDNESFSNLEALVVQLGPKECLIGQGDLGPDGAKLKQVSSLWKFAGTIILLFLY